MKDDDDGDHHCHGYGNDDDDDNNDDDESGHVTQMERILLYELRERERENRTLFHCKP